MRKPTVEAAGRSNMNPKKKIKVKCYRCNPKTGEKPHYQTYEVPVEPLMTIMDALDYIYENLDSTLSYHYTACRHGVCTRCMVAVNGEGMLACVALADKDMTIDPVTKTKVAKDLIVETL